MKSLNSCNVPVPGPRATRRYLFIASRAPGHFMFWPHRTVTSNLEIRALVIFMFRKWFGTEPTFHWHSDGFMAQAWDKRGNKMELQQLNAYDNCEPDYSLLMLEDRK